MEKTAFFVLPEMGRLSQQLSTFSMKIPSSERKWPSEPERTVGDSEKKRADSIWNRYIRSHGKEKRKMASEPKVSVIMSLYNPRPFHWLKAAVDSILDQSFKDFEFLIYDDGSDEECRRFIEKIGQLDPRIRILRGEENQGIAY